MGLNRVRTDGTPSKKMNVRWLALGAALMVAFPALANARGSDTDDDDADAPAPNKKAAKAQTKADPQDEADDTDDTDDADAAPARGKKPKLDVVDEDQAPSKPEPRPDISPERPISFHSNGWTASFYGFAELDVMGDSTRSFPQEGSLNFTLARPNTVAGDNPSLHITARNSRFGFSADAPEWNSIKAKTVIEMDFFGNQPPASTQNDLFTNGTLRMRLFYLRLDTPVIDVIAGQYHDLFAWNGGQFYPNTVAYLPVVGEVYHRNPQLRLSKTFGSTVSVQLAVAAVRPVQSDSAVPDGQAGVKLTVNGFRGAATPGASRPVVAPLAIGVSAVGRHLSVNDFSSTPGNPQTLNVGGIAVNAFLPIIPARGNNLGNALSVTGEFTTGSGISDLYPGLTGGVGFPSLPNPNNTQVVPQYTPDIDAGIVTFDANFQLQAIKWTGLIINGHYHLPVAEGRRIWLSGTYAMAKSSNDLDLTPQANQQFTWNRSVYWDLNLWLALTPSVELAFSFQRTQQTFGDEVVATNNRGEGAFYMFF